MTHKVHKVAMLFVSGQKKNHERKGIWTILLGWFRRRSFQSVNDEPDDRPSSSSDEEDDVLDDDGDENNHNDDMSGYLDVTIEDLIQRSRSDHILSPITEEVTLPVVISQEARSPLSKYHRSTATELRSPSALRLSRSKLPPSLKANVSPRPSPASPNFSMVQVVKPPPLLESKRFVRTRTQDSFQGSLESIDSLVESYWDPEDDASHITPVATNLARSSEFFFEHVRFLKVQTQPRQVEVVWSTPPDKPKLPL